MLENIRDVGHGGDDGLGQFDRGVALDGVARASQDDAGGAVNRAVLGQLPMRVEAGGGQFAGEDGGLDAGVGEVVTGQVDAGRHLGVE